MEPYHSIDLTEIIVDDDDSFVVLRSPESAEDSPDYAAVIDFATRQEAETFFEKWRCGSIVI
jgi:hypothetical protein